ncbi:hypothetical protein [uncultured Jannaschia sp.]|uniref:hypothetical protein n=1 Tax=uncultured Jannaschia sp. TaxID=293347 RepID=UPI0026230430|nr:hypothetical protein [uncultured Jannaschia sp.]
MDRASIHGWGVSSGLEEQEVELVVEGRALIEERPVWFSPRVRSTQNVRPLFLEQGAGEPIKPKAIDDSGSDTVYGFVPSELSGNRTIDIRLTPRRADIPVPNHGRAV